MEERNVAQTDKDAKSLLCPGVNLQAKMVFAFFVRPQTVFSMHVKTADTVLWVKERTIIQRPAFFRPLISLSMQHELCWGGISLFPVQLSSPSLAGRFLKVLCWRKEKNPNVTAGTFLECASRVVGVDTA